VNTSRRRSFLGLVGSWVVYWFVLALVKLGPAALAIYQATRGTKTDTANVSINFSNTLFSLIVTDHGQTTWSGSVHLVALILWIGLVPLALWVAWLYTRSSSKSSDVVERQRI
jgi:hypothetical protein